MSKNITNLNQTSILPADDCAIVGRRGPSSTPSSAAISSSSSSMSSRRGQSTAVSGGFDVTSAEMPGTQTPGRREPVRGDTSLSTSSSSSSTSSNTPIETTYGHHNAPQPATSNSRNPITRNDDLEMHRSSIAGTDYIDSNRQSSSTPAGAVPIANRVSIAYFPPSPPSTVASTDSRPASPLIDFGSVHLVDEPILEEGFSESQEDKEERKGKDGTQEQTSERAVGLGVPSPSANSITHREVSLTERHKASARTTYQPSPLSAMPDTPQQTPTTVSPAVTAYAHHPTASGQRFFCSLLEDFPLQAGAEHVIGTVSDAGIDLVCQGWSGAILDQSRLASYVNSSSGPLSNNTTGRALFALLPAAAQAEKLREEVLSVLDLASEELKCDVVFMAVNRFGMKEADWKAILHGLCYVGGSVVATGGLKGDAGRENLTGCKVRDGIVLVAVEM